MRIRGRGSMKSGKLVGVLIGLNAVRFGHTSPEHRHNFYMVFGAVWYFPYAGGSPFTISTRVPMGTRKKLL